MARTALLLFFVLMAGTIAASAETPEVAVTGGTTVLPISPVEQVRKNQSWEFGPFVNGGWGLGSRDNFLFFSAGVQAG